MLNLTHLIVYDDKITITCTVTKIRISEFQSFYYFIFCFIVEFGLSGKQAEALLDMTLRKLTALEVTNFNVFFNILLVVYLIICCVNFPSYRERSLLTRPQC
jgi:hypothetical protein